MENKRTFVYKSKRDGLWTVKYWSRWGYAPRYAKYSDWSVAIICAFQLTELHHG